MSILLESLVRDSFTETPRTTVFTELVAFGAVGGIASLSFVALSTVMTGVETGLSDWVVSALCYALFIVPTYLAHRQFSFRSDASHAVALPRYVAVQVSGLGLAAVFSYLAYAILGLSSGWAALVVIGLTAAVNFMVLKLWAFAQRS